MSTAGLILPIDCIDFDTIHQNFYAAFSTVFILNE